jgi:hypothetical protein
MCAFVGRDSDYGFRSTPADLPAPLPPPLFAYRRPRPGFSAKHRRTLIAIRLDGALALARVCVNAFGVAPRLELYFCPCLSCLRSLRRASAFVCALCSWERASAGCK